MLMLLAVVKLSERLDWGFRNANVTATLIALLMTSIWALPALIPSATVSSPPGKVRKKKLMRALREALWLVALCITIWLSAKLFQTGSRGGALAALGGLCAMLAAHLGQWRQWGLWRVSAALIALGISSTIALQTHPAERLAPTYSIGDASAGNRLRIWKWAPAMIADAPGGWGHGKAPKAFTAWYQDADHPHEYAALVNSHIEFLVENAWPLRLVYLISWLLALRLAWPEDAYTPHSRRLNRVKNFPLAPLGTLVAWAIGSTFTTMHTEWQLWLPPSLLLLWILLIRHHHRQWPTPQNLAKTVLTPTLILTLSCLLASRTSPLSSHANGNNVKLGTGPAQVVILAGAGTREKARELRTAWATHPSPPTVLWATQPQDIPPQDTHPTHLVLLGKADILTWTPLISQATHILIPAPEFPPEVFFDKTTLPKVQAHYGELSTATHLSAWQNTNQCTISPATGDFFNNWTQKILNKESPTNSPDEKK